MKRIVLTVAALGAFGISGCDVCAGTPSCTNPPEVSASGQFIERSTGAPVAGVTVEFVREAGAELRADTVRAVTDADGFFHLRSDALGVGTAVGVLRVLPPAPRRAFEIPEVRLEVTTRRADGQFLGRLSVEPYMVLVGQLYDRYTGANVVNATVVMRRTGGAAIGADSAVFFTDQNGRFAWIDPSGIGAGVIEAEFEVRAPGYPRAYVVPREIRTLYRDADIAFVTLPVGAGISYWGIVSRRGSDDRLPGVQVTFRRTSGLAISPDVYETTARDDGFFMITIPEDRPGTVTGDLVVTPPAPWEPQVTRDVTLAVRDDNTPIDLGLFGFGAQVFLSAYFRYRATGEPAAGLLAEVRRSGGMQTLAPPQDQGLRSLTADGRLVYAAATADTGTVLYDITVFLPPPLAPETLKAVPVRARFSDGPIELGLFDVGPPGGAVRRGTP